MIEDIELAENRNWTKGFVKGVGRFVNRVSHSLLYNRKEMNILKKEKKGIACGRGGETLRMSETVMTRIYGAHNC